MFSIFKKKKVVPHVRLTGVIGSAGRFRQGMDLAGQKDILKKEHLLVIHREKNTSKNLEKYLNILENRIYGRSENFFGKLYG